MMSIQPRFQLSPCVVLDCFREACCYVLTNDPKANDILKDGSIKYSLHKLWIFALMAAHSAFELLEQVHSL